MVPAVQAWKAQRQQQAQADRGPNALGIGLSGLAVAGLGFGGYKLYEHLRQKGLNARDAAEVAESVDQAQVPQLKNRSFDETRGPAPVAIDRSKKNGRIFQKPLGRQPTSKGSRGVRDMDGDGRGAYGTGKSNLRNDLTWGPQIAAVTNEADGQALINRAHREDPEIASRLAEILEADLFGESKPRLINASELQATKGREGDLVTTRGEKGKPGRTYERIDGEWKEASVDALVSRMGEWSDTTTAGESEAKAFQEKGKHMPQSRRTSGEMFQPGYEPGDQTGNALINAQSVKKLPKEWQQKVEISEEVGPHLERFLLQKTDNGPVPLRLSDLSSSDKVGLGPTDLLGPDDVGRDGERLRPEDDSLPPDIDLRLAARKDPYELFEARKDERFFDTEDATTKGMQESLPTQARSPKQVRIAMDRTLFRDQLHGNYDSDLRSRPGLTNLSFDHEVEPRFASDTYTGKTWEEGVGADEDMEPIKAEMGSARRANPDAPTVGRPAVDRSAVPYTGAHAVGGRSGNDWARQLVSGLLSRRLSGRAVEEAALRNGASAEVATQLERQVSKVPEWTANLKGQLPGLPAEQAVSIVGEAIADAVADYPKALDWAQRNGYASQAELGAPGGVFFDAFMKTYIRKSAMLNGLEAKAPTAPARATQINLPTDVGELLVERAKSHGISLQQELDLAVRGSSSPAEALLKLDGMVSDVASLSSDDPNAISSKVAEGFTRDATAGDGSRFGALKERLGATQTVGGSAGREAVASRLPIAIGFGSRTAGVEVLPDDDGKAVIDQAVTADATPQSRSDVVAWAKQRRSGPTYDLEGNRIGYDDDWNPTDKPGIEGSFPEDWDGQIKTSRRPSSGADDASSGADAAFGAALKKAYGQGGLPVSAQSFGVNKVLANRFFAASKESLNVASEFERGLINGEQADERLQAAKAVMQETVDEQIAINGDRGLIGKTLRQFNKDGEGLVLELDGRSGSVHAGRAGFSQPLSLDKQVGDDEGSTLHNEAVDLSGDDRVLRSASRFRSLLEDPQVKGYPLRVQLQLGAEIAAQDGVDFNAMLDATRRGGRSETRRTAAAASGTLKGDKLDGVTPLTDAEARRAFDGRSEVDPLTPQLDAYLARKARVEPEPMAEVTVRPQFVGPAEPPASEPRRLPKPSFAPEPQAKDVGYQIGSDREYEEKVARAGHEADYWDNFASSGLTKNLKSKKGMTPYSEPSKPTIDARIGRLRRLGILKGSSLPSQ